MLSVADNFQVWLGTISKKGLLKKSKLAQYAYEECYRLGWDEAQILNIESNRRHRKYRESAHMAYLTHSVSQPSLDISPIWIPLISNVVGSSWGRSVYKYYVSRHYPLLFFI
jgi:hypothetical protein